MAKQLLLDLNPYFHAINEAIVCRPGMKKAFIADLNRRVSEFVDEYRPESVEDVIAHFGRPEEIAHAFLETLDPSHIKKAMNWKRVVIIGVIVFLLIWAIFGVFMFIRANYETRGYKVNDDAVEVIKDGGLISHEKNDYAGYHTHSGDGSAFNPHIRF